MKRNLLKSLKFCSLFVIAFLAIIIFTPACQKETEYYPSAKFILKGLVLCDSLKQPMEGVIVILYHETKSFDSLTVDSRDILIDTEVTNSAGIFQVTDSLGIPVKSAYNLAFIDTTIKGNVTFLTYEFKNPAFTNGDGHWYAGETIQIDTFLLKTH